MFSTRSVCSVSSCLPSPDPLNNISWDLQYNGSAPVTCFLCVYFVCYTDTTNGLSYKNHDLSCVWFMWCDWFMGCVWFMCFVTCLVQVFCDVFGSSVLWCVWFMCLCWVMCLVHVSGSCIWFMCLVSCVCVGLCVWFMCLVHVFGSCVLWGVWFMCLCLVHVLHI